MDSSKILCRFLCSALISKSDLCQKFFSFRIEYHDITGCLLILPRDMFHRNNHEAHVLVLGYHFSFAFTIFFTIRSIFFICNDILFSNTVFIISCIMYDAIGLQIHYLFKFAGFKLLVFHMHIKIKYLATCCYCEHTVGETKFFDVNRDVYA